MSELSTDQYPMTPRPVTSARNILGDTQKKTLGISAAAMLLGGAAWAISQKIQGGPDGKHTPDDGATVPPNTPDETNLPVGADETTSPTLILPSDVDVAGKVTNEMSFGQAFIAAREEVGMGGVFSWHGHWYNTFEKDEWTSLSLEQRQTYTEQITGEKLPVISYHHYVALETEEAELPIEPTIIEGHLNGQRVMGLDYDHDGVIDVVVMDGADGTMYRVVDAVGDDGLDTAYQYNALTGQMTGAVLLDHPVVLSNDQFSQGLEESMSREVVESILGPDADAPMPTQLTGDAESDASIDPHDTEDAEDIEDETVMLAGSHEPDDTYVNDGDVQDMDE